ncbi:methionine ABC transporter ATP-binding protein [Amycolatopsis cihanbeyliensis]|uniref:D-methionine transport system ATP-binding protein n=1 Tax=Amycolatopsis cihanbeyliensis TaxID=1128664 RepID=A0A542DR06_AMYCI|nr:ATP-binding cassette domain-containing protein [Amycolatopsis cihanbeyliensis]TQJ05395.1 D-methionine transport system ATP-binding protein [Amycolatopsis cihanbeyliensis]
MITVENLSKSFRSGNAPVVALRDISLEIGAGSLYGVVGPEGAGKSTLARCVALQERPDRGTVRLDGLNTGTLDGRRLRELRRQVGVVDTQAALHAERTVAGNVAAPLERLRVDGPGRRDRVGKLLDLAGLTRRATQSPGELSAGQRRRTEIARALVTGPSVLLADDPTEGVGAEESAAVLTVLDRARAELGVTVVLTTKDGNVARRVCEDVALLEQGALVESGNLLGLLSDPGSRAARQLLPAIDTSPAQAASYDRVADVVLVGFAAVGALLPEAAGRFGTEFATIGGGLTRVGDTPVARFRLGLRGDQADAALSWIAERGARVTHAARGPQGVAA